MVNIRKDCVKNINLCIEKVLENFSEIVEFLQVSNPSKLNEMKSLVFSKKKACEVLQNIEIIFQNLVQLKLVHRNFHLKYENIDSQKSFGKFFEEINKNLDFPH